MDGEGGRREAEGACVIYVAAQYKARLPLAFIWNHHGNRNNSHRMKCRSSKIVDVAKFQLREGGPGRLWSTVLLTVDHRGLVSAIARHGNYTRSFGQTANSSPPLPDL